MSYDLYFWPSGVAVDAQELAERLADEDVAGLVADGRVLEFRAELLRRWPNLADMIAPWHDDLDWRLPWGRTDLADRFVGLTLPYSWEATAALQVVAGAYGLDTYDPQAGRLVPARDGADLADTARVDGRVTEERLVGLLRQISGFIGYAYDELDEAALTGALEGGWFEYPLAGTPRLLVRLAAAGAHVRVRVEGDMDLVLAARIEALME